MTNLPNAGVGLYQMVGWTVCLLLCARVHFWCLRVRLIPMHVYTDAHACIYKLTHTHTHTRTHTRAHAHTTPHNINKETCTATQTDSETHRQRERESERATFLLRVINSQSIRGQVTSCCSPDMPYWAHPNAIIYRLLENVSRLFTLCYYSLSFAVHILQQKYSLKYCKHVNLNQSISFVNKHCNPLSMDRCHRICFTHGVWITCVRISAWRIISIMWHKTLIYLWVCVSACVWVCLYAYMGVCVSVWVCVCVCV